MIQVLKADFPISMTEGKRKVDPYHKISYMTSYFGCIKMVFEKRLSFVSSPIKKHAWQRLESGIGIYLPTLIKLRILTSI